MRSCDVSIRAPAKGAIRLHRLPCVRTWYVCFNPRPREGSDVTQEHALTHSSGITCFNPRPREGSDTSPAVTTTIHSDIVSIRAPAKGAMMQAWYLAILHHGVPFQSAPPRRERSARVAASALESAIWFQSAPPRRERFPPAVHLDLSDRNCVSIRAPAKGAILMDSRRHDYGALIGFNPRPREGSDFSWPRVQSRRGKESFQSAPPRRERFDR